MKLRTARAAVKRRAEGRCEADIADVCTAEGVHAHHVVLRSRGGTDDPHNLIWACTPCHAWIHDNPTEATALGLMATATKGTPQ